MWRSMEIVEQKRESGMNGQSAVYKPRHRAQLEFFSFLFFSFLIRQLRAEREDKLVP